MPIIATKNKKRFFKKSLGQNFLTDGNIVRKIISALDVREDDVIVEIGPGLGALTDELVKLPNRIIAIEKDDRFATRLNARYDLPNVSVIHGDALKYDFSTLYSERNKKLKVIGNLPYNVSTEILFRLLYNSGYFSTFLFMFQKEVAKRITARSSTKDYGILSVISQYFSYPSTVISVPPTCFKPAPKVDSAVVRFDIHDTPPFKVTDEKLLKAVVKTAFSKRRKTLRNCFKEFRFTDIVGFDIDSVFDSADIDPGRRGETLSVEEFVRLTERIGECEGNTGNGGDDVK